MDFKNISRRDFVKGSLSTLVLSSLPAPYVLSQTTPGIRLEWNNFRTTADYPYFIDAIRRMRANTNSADRNSWSYWVNSHVQYCPHGIAYFLVWHRGYVHYFQQTLRTISGRSQMMMPYWDYYKNPNMPTEFTDPSSPLYIAGRVNTNVYSALSMIPFSVRYKNFQRGLVDAFETQIEPRPHGGVHNLIGGQMATKSSPLDPIFWLHHGEIDRLWVAWVAAGEGRQMPPSTDPYWSGTLTYKPDLTLPRNRTIDTRTYLNYRYDVETFPTSLPPQAQSAQIIRAQAQDGAGRVPGRRPPVGRFPSSGPRQIGKNRRSVGSVREVGLDENSVTAQISVTAEDGQLIEDVIDRIQAPPFGPGQPSAPTYNSVQIVLDDVRITPQGRNGGYFYEVYLNLPESGAASEEPHFLTTFGPFEIDAHSHHNDGSQLVFPATHVLAGLAPNQIRDVTISFVRVSGQTTPRGRVIHIGEVRAELSNDDME